MFKRNMTEALFKQTKVWMERGKIACNDEEALAACKRMTKKFHRTRIGANMALFLNAGGNFIKREFSTKN